MAETARPKPMEFYNPRPLILGICFFWGVLMGFAINFFRAPEEPQTPPSAASAVMNGQTPLSDMERRYENTPDIAEVEPGPAVTASLRPNLEHIDIEPPPPLLTTEGGLTGRTAAPLGSQNRPSSLPTRGRPSGKAVPPPIPELMPR